ILVFDEPAVMHRFAEAVQHAVAAYNGQKSVESAKRRFRMGAATGAVLLLQAERRIVGTPVTRAVRLEAAAKNGQILVDVATYDSLPDSLKGFYGEEERISGKRDEWFFARRCTFVPTDEPDRCRWRASIIGSMIALTALIGAVVMITLFRREVDSQWPKQPTVLFITTGDVGYGKLHEDGLRES